jgi:predicted Mrr-cat superfamily restriction endonuclease
LKIQTVWRLLIEEPEMTLPWMWENKRLAIGWGEIGDVRALGSLDAIAEAIKIRNQHPRDHAGKPAANVQHGSHSLHDFCFKMKPGDLVIISDRTKRRQVWEVVGDYEYAERSAAPLNYQHQRKAQFVKMDADELWHRAGGKLVEGQINFRTLGQCAKAIE